jgi:RND family efflux transporter MFP subunit
MDDRSKLLETLRIDRDAPQTPSPGRRRWVLWTAGSLALVLVAGLVYWRMQVGREARLAAAAASAAADEVAGSGPTGAGAAGAGRRGASASLLDATGYVVARRQATVSATIPGRVTEVLIDEGSRVSAGQVIARLDDQPYRLALEQVRAQAAAARSLLAAAQVAFRNAQPIFERNQKQQSAGFLSAQDFDNARAAFDAARTAFDVQQRAVEVADTAVAAAQRNLTDTVIRAPFTGIVTYKGAQPGEIVSPQAAGGGYTRTGIGTIVDMDSLEVEVDVSENFINRVHPGQPATVRLNAYPDWDIAANVIAVIPTADRSKATVKVRVGFKTRDERILPEMGARVAFESAPT